MKIKKVAVAGATGFVGTAIIDSLLKKYEVRSVIVGSFFTLKSLPVTATGLQQKIKTLAPSATPRQIA